MRLDAEVIHGRRSAVTYARWENLVLPLRFAQHMEGWEQLPLPRRTAPARRAFDGAAVARVVRKAAPTVTETAGFGRRRSPSVEARERRASRRDRDRRSRGRSSRVRP